jgi:colicin import membrane protein
VNDQTTVERPNQASADIHASIDQVQGHLAVFDKISAGLAAIEQAHPKDVACNVATVAGMKQAIAGRAAWREPRIALEKARKAAKAPVLELGRNIDTFARSLETKLLEGETHYDDQIKAEEKRREEEREEKLRKEAERVAGIRRRIDEVFVSVPSMMDGSTAAELVDEIKRVVAIDIDAGFQELAGEAALAKDAALSSLRRMQEKAAAREADEARLKAEREELQRQREAQEAEDALVASIRANALRIEADSVPYIQKAINYFESGAKDWDGDPRPRVAEALATARKQMADKLAAAQERERVAAERKALEEQRAAARREESEARAAREKADREDRARRDEEDRRAREARAAEDKRIADERAALESQQRAAREAEERRQVEARRVEQERLDAEAAERRRVEEEEAAARRAAEEKKHKATVYLQQLGPRMLEILRQWQKADTGGNDRAMADVRAARDKLLKDLK